MRFYTVTFLFFLSFLSFAQHTITGKITDETNEPLPYANVLLYEAETNAVPKGAISNDNGDYLFENISDGYYFLEISVLGFEDRESEVFKLTKGKIIDFILKEVIQSLEEVVIKARRPVIRQTAEKLIVDLEKSEMINTSLKDVMRKVPGVLVTNNGISIAGNTGVRILINGKTTDYMDVQTLLRDFPADNISKIEVIEQPGAEYEASGSAAIINILLKKNVLLGTHGNLSFWMGEDEGFEWGSGFSIASYKNKINWQTNINYSQPTWRDDVHLIRTVGKEIYNQITKEPFDPDNFSISGNLDYYINDKNTLGLGGLLNSRNSERIVSNKTIISNENDSNILFSENSFNRKRKNFNINPYYEYNTETDKLVLDFNYIDYTNDNTNTLYRITGSTFPFTDRRYIQEGEYNIKTYRADYSKTFSENFTLSIGARYANVETANDLQSLVDNKGVFDLSDENSSQFLIDETIFAVYSKVNANFGKWSFSAGLRHEDSNTDGTSIYIKDNLTVTEINKRPIIKLFPSASISKKITESLGANLSYSYRIQRPSYNSLNSFETFLDPFSATEGNTNLTPAYTNNYQFNLTYKQQPFFTIGFSNTNDILFQLIQQDNVSAQIRRREVNVESSTKWNFRLFAPISFLQGLGGYTGIIVANTDYQSSNFAIDLNKWNLYWFVQANYKLPWDINFELSGTYGTGALVGQIDVDWLAELDFSFGKKFLDEKLRVNLGFNKMLNRSFLGNIDYGNGTALVDSNGSRQNVKLRLSYSFGSKFGKEKSPRIINRDEENRIQENN